jgi:hypothetical protein
MLGKMKPMFVVALAGTAALGTFQLEEATIAEINAAFDAGLTSRQLVSC